MTELNEQFELSENSYILTANQNDHYRLVSGSVLVYVIPIKKNRAGEPKLYCRITQNDSNRVIPALCCQDQEGNRWHLMIKPDNGSAVLTYFGGMQTNVLYIRFLERGHLPGDNAESFEKSMIAFYNNSVTLHENTKEPFLCVNSNDVYRIVSGEASVFVVPLEEGYPGTPQYCCTISASDKNPFMPSLVYMDQRRTMWFLMIRPEQKSVTISRFADSLTEQIKTYFLNRIKFDWSNPSDFEQSLIQYYEYKRSIDLNITDFFLTERTSDAYRLECGSVYVYITQVKNGRPEKPYFFCEISAEDSCKIIPGLAYEHFDHTHWRLMIKPSKGYVRLTPLLNQSSSEVQQSFLAHGNISSYEIEGFERSLVDYYVRKVEIPDRGFFVKAEQSDETSCQDVKDLFRDVFSGDGQSEHTSMPVYQALQFVCSKTKISLMKSEQLIIRCGKKASLQDVCQYSNIICRNVILDADWYKNDCGSFVGILDQEIIACAPDRHGKYLLFRTSDESITPLTEELATQISPNAYAIGRTLPMKALTQKDVFAFCRNSINSRDLSPYVLLSLLCSGIGILLPTLNQIIYDDYIPVGDIGNLAQLCFVMLTFMIGNISFSIVKNLFGYRITSKVGIDLQNAVYHRLFHLPETYFRKYDSADLAGRIAEIGPVASRYANALVLSNVCSVFSVFYLIRMFQYNSKLTWFSLAIYCVYLVFIVIMTSTAQKSQLRIAEAESESSGKLYQYLNGLDKIRMAGVEERALLSFMHPYTRQQYEEIKANKLVSVEEALTSVIKYIFAMLLYWYIVKKLQTNDITVGTFAAFNSAFGSFTAALSSLVDEGLLLFQQRHTFKRFWSVFETAPEDDANKEMPGAISGALSVEHVHFFYDETHKVLDDVSMQIQPGEYIGIVGPSGCGKSTLLKLLLGFEQPQKGSVLVGKKNLNSINKAAYRKQLGVVLQNGKLISGSIYENITITAPDANVKRVNEVLSQVGLLEDIQQMPMGIHTILGENSNTISGGQQQRILIARAICGNPKILIFDEATSALDNINQAKVIQSLDQMNVTRIVVAHRLSTIQHCDRIYVMQDGKVVQQGNYQTLMQDQNGLFYQLASRQIAQ